MPKLRTTTPASLTTTTMPATELDSIRHLAVAKALAQARVRAAQEAHLTTQHDLADALDAYRAAKHAWGAAIDRLEAESVGGGEN